ncbi:ABC transporter ATP-binding protein [Nocardioides marmoriginsengisoli]|uniref:ABC transporter ATP-binding protein n=1 Tax=Nocardioides marmoriginsengisoli TaxID=661483 RepID=A0A3N0CEN8_9ACTN|nr:ABC transporter ATP-binding protein [Nocardioides marmoriginsengisoli]RNL61917.1 ABC transporter ATP-binding protein [Nocardioides marmoriginsengisoli]
MALLSVEDVDLGYGELTVVHGLTFEVNAGEVVALLGPNGAGKTTTMNGISGVLKPKRGRIVLDGKNLAGRAAHHVVAEGFRHVPEGRRVFGTLSVKENLRLGAYSLRKKPSLIAERVKEVYDLFPVLGERREQLAGTLSGGEQQMLAVGRALVTRPRVLALDEPSLGLSPRMQHEILGVASDLASQGTAVLLVEQNVREALRIADRAYVIELGRVVLTGTGKELAADKRIEATYLGGGSDELESEAAEA